MKLDIFNHIFPPPFFAKLYELLPKGPVDPEGGRIFMRDTIAVIDSLRCSDADREAMYSSNARALLGPD